MKIAVYYPWIYTKSGVEKTILALATDTRNTYTIFTNHYDRDATFDDFSNLEIVQLTKISTNRSLLNVLIAAFTIGSQKINLENFDLLLVQSEGLGDLILLKNSSIPVVCYCHTPLRPVYDEHYKKRAFKGFKPVGKLFFNLFSFAFEIVDRYLWKKYDYIFFNSKETYNRALKGRLISKTVNNFEVLHPPVFIKNQKNKVKFKDFFLLPGRIMWTKNIELAIKSFIRLKTHRKLKRDFKLIIAGHLDYKSKEYFQKLISLIKNREDILFILDPSQKKLDLLYQECMCVVSSSFNEDFGITLIEGNHFGKGVIAINRGGPKESQINGVTGILVKENVLSMSKAMQIMSVSSTAKEIGAAAKTNAKKYSLNNFIFRIQNQFNRLVFSERLPN